MTLEQLALSLVVALLTAAGTALINNHFEQGRQDRAWKREKEERRAQYKRLRLEEKLRPVEAWIKNVIEVAESVSQILPPDDSAFLILNWDGWRAQIGRAQERSSSLSLEFATIAAMVSSVGDSEMTNLWRDFCAAWADVPDILGKVAGIDYVRSSDRDNVIKRLSGELEATRRPLNEKATMLFSKIESVLEAVGS